jgi:two-component system response regulator RegA
LDLASPADKRTVSLKSLKVFVVDDDRDFAEGIGLSLELEGHEVTFAYSGEEAVSKFDDIECDVTLMDVRMPGMNGVEALRSLLEIRPDAKVVMITAYKAEELSSQALTGGALSVLQKPVSSKKLIETFREIQAAGVVLLADDDPDFAAGVEAILVSEGYVVFKAKNGQEAIDKFGDENIDVLLLDVRMPDLNGVEVYAGLKRLGHNPPTIVVTGYSTEESGAIQELLRSSARDWLVKPIASDDLLRAISQAL